MYLSLIDLIVFHTSRASVLRSEMNIKKPMITMRKMAVLTRLFIYICSDIYYDTALMIRIHLNNIRSAFNVGSIMRSANGAGVDEIVFGGITPHWTHPHVEKTALKAEKDLKLTQFNDLYQPLLEIKERGEEIIALEITDNSIDYSDYTRDSDKILNIIVGNEVLGVDTQLLELADTHVHLPMRGSKISLNVAIATSILIYDIAK